ncbi:MAG TPA: hypothetical protein PLK30_24800, partial [Blastocatellia bacterium]|nr:hypothetical protein [Blastocatellia bacterium]
MSHPFSWFASSYRWPLFSFLLAGTVLFACLLTCQGKPLRTSAAPSGILSYEFAWTKPQADSILTSWASMKETARQQLLLDFGFLVFYPLTLSLACAMLAGSAFNKMAVVGAFLSWAVLLAGPLDAVENLSLLRMLGTGGSEFLARLAGVCAGV